jgi:hypothetical protein
VVVARCASILLVALLVCHSLGALLESGMCSGPLQPDDAKVLWAIQLPDTEPEYPTKGLAVRDLPESKTNGLAFLDNDRVVVYRVHHSGDLASRVNIDAASSFRLEAVFFKADSGATDFTKNWGAHPRDSVIRSVRGGLIVQTGSEIRFFSRDLIEISHLHFPESSDPVIGVSPSGDTIVFNLHKSDQSEFQVRDGSSFELKKTWTERPTLYHPFSISDHAITVADSRQEHILLREFGSAKWRALGAFKTGGVGWPAFVSETLVVNANGRELSIWSVNGEQFLNDYSDRHETFEDNPITVSTSGSLLGVSIVQGKGGWLDTDVTRTGNRVAIYSTTLRRRILTLNIAPLPRRYFSFGLSPDGQKLAVLNDGVLSMFSISLH